MNIALGIRITREKEKSKAEILLNKEKILPLHSQSEMMHQGLIR